MPQIWPMNWLVLFLVFISIFLMFLAVIYFFNFNINLASTEEKSSTVLTAYSWKW